MALSSTNVSEKPASGERLGKILSDDYYLRTRLDPRWRDLHYLALTDLLHCVRDFAETVRGRVFDYGCGGAPYKSLFHQVESYVGADVTPGPEVDVLLKEDGKTNEPDQSCDGILSSQVLEHVVRPEDYLKECLRLLKPGGSLLVTTHGMFEEHGCPHDYHRWTARGLESLLQECGFEVEQSWKLTGASRGAIQMLHFLILHLRNPQRTLIHLAFKIFRVGYLRLAAPFLNAFGSLFHNQGVVPSNDEILLYIGIAVHARRPRRSRR